MEPDTNPVMAYSTVAVANRPDSDNCIYSESELRILHNGRDVIYDERTGRLLARADSPIARLNKLKRAVDCARQANSAMGSQSVGSKEIHAESGGSFQAHRNPLEMPPRHGKNGGDH